MAAADAGNYGSDDVTATEMGDASAVIDANIRYHAALAEHYDENQPHGRPENVRRLQRVFQTIAEATGGGSLLDLGCGTGFILNLARPYFKRLVGADITPAMLQRVDTDDGRIELIEADTAALPLPDGSFDVVVAHGFLHHLYDLRPTLQEAARVLRPGGVLYADQDPNRHCWSLLHGLRGEIGLPATVEREVRSVVEVTATICNETGLTPETVELAEYQKILRGGLDPDEIVDLLREVGFAVASYRLEWFIGEGGLLHGADPAHRDVVDAYLRAQLPATRHLFKYVSLRGTR